MAKIVRVPTGTDLLIAELTQQRKSPSMTVDLIIFSFFL